MIKFVPVVLKPLGGFLRKNWREILAILGPIVWDEVKRRLRKRAKAEIRRRAQRRLRINVIILLVQIGVLGVTLFASTYFKNPWPIRIAVWSVIAWTIYSIPIGLRNAFQFWDEYKKLKPILQFLEVNLIESVVAPSIISLLITFGLLFFLRAGLVYSFGADSFRELLRYLFSLKEVIKI